MARRVIVRNAIVAEYEGGNLVISARMNGRMRTYVLSPGEGCRLTVTVDGHTAEIDLRPVTCARAA